MAPPPANASRQLAQVNIAWLKRDLPAETLDAFMARVAEINALAERSRGFVWRPQTTPPDELLVFREYITPFEPARLFYNLSVWRRVEDLRAYVFRSAHVEMWKARSTWFEPLRVPTLAMWWVPEGHLPTVAESADTLRRLRDDGPGVEIFARL